MKHNIFLSVSRRWRNFFVTSNWISNFCLVLYFSPSEHLLKCHSEQPHCPFIFLLFLLINNLMSRVDAAACHLKVTDRGRIAKLAAALHIQLELPARLTGFDIRLCYKGTWLLLVNLWKSKLYHLFTEHLLRCIISNPKTRLGSLKCPLVDTENMKCHWNEGKLLFTFFL